MGHPADAVGAQHENLLKESQKKLEDFENTGEEVEAAVPAPKEALSRQSSMKLSFIHLLYFFERQQAKAAFLSLKETLSLSVTNS